MKTCFDCGTELLGSSGFCHKCGQPVKSKRNELEADAAIKAKSKAEWDEVTQRINKAAASHNRIVMLIALSCVVLSILFFVGGGKNSGLYGFGCFAAAILASKFAVARDRWLHSSEYYALSGSRDNSEGHRCIFCGGRGIYRKGVYASNSTLANCTKCQAGLFYE